MKESALYVVCVSVVLSVLSGMIRYVYQVKETSTVIRNIDQRVHFITKDSPKVRRRRRFTFFFFSLSLN